MGPTRMPLGKVGAAIITTVVASLAIAGPVGASEHSGTVTVEGTIASSIQLTVPDASAQFGTNLNPDGTASNSLDGVDVNVDGSDPSTGACYEWDSNVTVNSNVAYDVLVTAGAANAILDFLTSDPGTFAACTGGEPVDTAMFELATPAGTWADNAAETASADHPYLLGLDVQWTGGTGALTGTVVTLSAQANS